MIYKQSLADREAILKEQNWTCAICTRRFKPGGEYVPFQDHDHRCCPVRFKKYCGKCNRGILCFICNKKVVGALERIYKLGIDINKAILYISDWDKKLKKKGAYASKEPPKRKKKVKRLRKIQEVV